MSNNNNSPKAVSFVSVNTEYGSRQIMINGGSDVAQTDFSIVKSAMYALQDYIMGIYDLSIPGLHINARIPAETLMHKNVGSIGPKYRGRIMNAPQEWTRLALLDDTYVPVGYKSDGHRGNSKRKHALLEILREGHGMTIQLGPRTAKIWDGSVSVIIDMFQAGKVENAFALRSQNIGGKIVGDRTYRRAKAEQRDNPGLPMAEVIISTTEPQTEVDMFAVEAGTFVPTFVARVDGSLRPLKSVIWSPEKDMSVRWWKQFANDGGVIELS
jgi:hypothetical protein